MSQIVSSFKCPDSFFNRHYSIEFSAAPAHIDNINLEALPITNIVCCVFVEVADNSISQNTRLFLYLAVVSGLKHGTD